MSGDYKITKGEQGEHMTFYGMKSYARRKNDVYPTPPEAIEALLRVEHFRGHVLDPCCGDGRIAEAVAATHKGDHGVRNEVTAFDLESSYGDQGIDFLRYEPEEPFSHTVMNPPYRYAQAFVDKALLMTRYKIAVLLRLAFLEGQARKTFFKRVPLRKVYVFSRRLSFNKIKGGSCAYAWFVFEKPQNYAELIASHPEPVIKWI